LNINKIINDNKLSVGLFQWQQSCSAFSVSKRDISKVCNYIDNQKEHHTKESYTEEYETFLKFYQQTIQKRKKWGNEVDVYGDNSLLLRLFCLEN